MARTDHSLVTPDPYDPRPTLWQRHPHLGWGLGVFVLTVVLTYVAFPPVNVGEAGYVMLIPAALWAYLRPQLKPFLWSVLGAQIVAWTLLLGWISNVSWLGLLLLGPVMGLLNGAWFVVAWWWIPRMRGHRMLIRLLALFGLAGLWVMAEWVRGWIFGGFPWLPLAASQWMRPLLLQAASYGGAWVVSFVLVCFNLGAAAYAHRIFFEGATGLRKRSPEFMWALMLLVFSSFPFLGEMLKPQRSKIARVAFVQPNIPQGQKWDPARATEVLRTIEKSTLDANDAGVPEVILLPEAVAPWALFRDPNVQPWLESLAQRTGKPILLGSVFSEGSAGDERWFNGAFVVDPVTGLDRNGYAKRKLVPFGEFVPFRSVLGWLEKFVPIGGDFQPGDHSRPLLLAAGRNIVPVGVLICYEDIFPHLARESVRDGAEVLAVLTNNGWFGEGGAAYQHATHSVLRAVENRRPLIRVGNAGWSGWIDEFGNIRLNLRDENGSVYFRGAQSANVMRDLRWANRQSFYTEHGDWFLVVAAVLATIGYYLVLTLRPPLLSKDGEPVF
ncbi:MAG: apolipoprotein N-acyltransferase [Opitutus sp.]|nr:apolipoprotein N-acyltransferase [Opitutus sp.]